MDAQQFKQLQQFEQVMLQELRLGYIGTAEATANESSVEVYETWRQQFAVETPPSIAACLPNVADVDVAMFQVFTHRIVAIRKSSYVVGYAATFGWQLDDGRVFLFNAECTPNWHIIPAEQLCNVPIIQDYHRSAEDTAPF